MEDDFIVGVCVEGASVPGAAEVVHSLGLLLTLGAGGEEGLLE